MRLSRILISSRFFLINLFLNALILTSYYTVSYGGEVTLAWRASTDATVIGYKIYRGTSTGVYKDDKTMDVGNVTTAVITDLDSGKVYYFSATAYDADGDESTFCNEVEFTVPLTDSDRDGIPNADEQNLYGTDPNNPDSDGDGISDGEELSFWGNAWNADVDNDGIINLLDKDADGDGMSDGYEVSNGGNPSIYDSAAPTNRPPSGTNDLYQVSSNGLLSVTASKGVLSNDTDPEGARLEAVLVSQPSRGTLELFTDGSFTYAAGPGFAGADSFTYYPSDGHQDGNSTTVTLWGETGATSQRVSDGLVVLYDFQEGSGTRVRDVSGAGTPLDLSISNISAVGWIAGGGLSLEAPVTISSEGAATKIIEALQSANAFTIETWVRPANTTQRGPARIVSCSADPYRTQNFMLGTGHWGYGPTDVVDARLLGRTLTTPADSLTTDLTHLVFTRESNGTAKVYIDGELQGSATVAGNFASWNKSFPLVLGNEPTGDRPWLGEMHLVAIYNRALPASAVEMNFDAGPAADFDSEPTDPVEPGDNQLPDNSAPTANDDVYTITADTQLVVSAAEGVLANDDDSDGDTLIAVLAGGSGPSSGSLTLNANGSLTYAPNAGFSGTDGFSYYAEDPSGSREIAQVTITINRQSTTTTWWNTWNWWQPSRYRR